MRLIKYWDEMGENSKWHALGTVKSFDHRDKVSAMKLSVQGMKG